MKELSREQELSIIKSLTSDNFLNNGGGRVVFELPIEMNRILGIPTDREYVVKVALGDKGLNQNELEVKQYMLHKNEVSLAEIVAVGHVLTLMEKVDTQLAEDIRCCYDEDIYDDNEEDDEFDGDYNVSFLRRNIQEVYDWDYDEADEGAYSIIEIFNNLNSIYGFTSDNGQIGLNADGCFVAFDYGFDPDRGCCEQCSSTRDYIESDDCCEIFLNTLIENIYNNPDMWRCCPHGLMSIVETEFFAYINDEEPEHDVLDFEPAVNELDYTNIAINSKKVLDNSYIA